MEFERRSAAAAYHSKKNLEPIRAIPTQAPSSSEEVERNADRTTGNIDNILAEFKGNTSQSALLQRQEPVDFLRQVDTVLASNQEALRPSETAGNAEWINYFDTNWEEEGLPQEWYSLKSQQSKKRVGFIMSRQMARLSNPYDATARDRFVAETRRNLDGFALEFLSDSVVYPRKYTINKNDPTRLEDKLYGLKDVDPHPDIVELVSEEERNGSVKKATTEMKQFLLSSPDGSLAVMTSPLGPTGFRTDDGLGIDYPDSYFFIQIRKGNEVMNYTLKTSFSLAQCREAILRLTEGKVVLPVGAPLEAYVSAIAKIRPGESGSIETIDDVISLLQDIRPDGIFTDPQTKKETSWQKARELIAQGEELYNFEEKRTRILNDFETYAREKWHTTKEHEKNIAATILRLGEEFFSHKESKKEEKVLRPNTWLDLRKEEQIGGKQFTFGEILQKTAEQRGCTGSSTSVTTLGGERRGTIEGKKDCEHCGGSAKDNHYHCPGCNLSYADETNAAKRTEKCNCGFEFACF